MTTSAVVYSFLFIHVGVILVATAYFVIGAALAPTMTSRARTRLARRPWLPVVIGAVISVPWVLAAVALLAAAAAPIKFVGAVVGGTWVLLGLLGGAGVAQHVGRTSAGGEPTWSQTARGGLFLCLTWVLPLVGWLVMLPLTLAAGIGCVVLGAFPVKSAASPVAVA